MATTREVDELADKMASGLQLDPGGQLLDMEELVYKASAPELEMLRKQVLQKQSWSGFDDVGLIKRFVQATKPKGAETGAGDNNHSFFNCFQNQIMMPTAVEQRRLIPEDLSKEWLCTVCPEGCRVLVIASHQSTRVYDLEGTWICEHDTHLPGGSPHEVSKLDDEGQCTILDCLYNDDNEIYHVVDLLCWKGVSYYKFETSVRMTAIAEKMKDVPSLKNVSHTNPFRFYTLPQTASSQVHTICNAISRARFEITGLLFYHKHALYLPGLTPLGIWVETDFVPLTLDIGMDRLHYRHFESGRRDWRKTRYDCSPNDHLRNSGKSQRNRNQDWNQNRQYSGQRGGQYQGFANYNSQPFPMLHGNMGMDYGGFGGYNMNYMHQQFHHQQYYHYPHQQKYSQGQGHGQGQKDGRHQRRKIVEGAIKKIQLAIPVPDDRPNWDGEERHEVMMSVSMEYVPENFDKEYVGVICPVAKRRIVVSYLGWTCSYNKLLNMDRKFQSSLPGGNVRAIQVIKSNDMCVLDCLHLKAERTFYMLDLMHWKQLPYYLSDAEFRFHWINQVENEMDLTSVHPENEYKFKSMPRIPCTQEKLYEALDKTTFKVDGLLFFQKNGNYVPGTSPNVLWLPPEDIEKILGWKPPEHVIPAKKRTASTGSTTGPEGKASVSSSVKVSEAKASQLTTADTEDAS